MHLRSDYEGPKSVWTPIIMPELVRALHNTGPAIWDGNCQLVIISPSGTVFAIFVDCGDFDYFDWIRWQDHYLEFGHPVCRELEYNFRDEEITLFNKLVSW